MSPRMRQQIRLIAGIWLAWTHIRTILLTHIQMGHDPAVAAAAVRAGFDGEVRVAEPGMEVALRAWSSGVSSSIVRSPICASISKASWTGWRGPVRA